MEIELFACPCCGYKTFIEKPGGTYEICAVCYWEDDQIQFANPDYEGGANRVSLRQAQRNFSEFGACEKGGMQYVRHPDKDEQRDKNWKPLDK